MDAIFNLKNIIKNHKTVFVISFILFIIPFFWTKPGEINMGGDGGSLYYYDPLNLIKHYLLYYMYPFGTGTVDARYYLLPFVSVLAFFKSFIFSPHLLSVLHNSLKLTAGFLSMFAIMKVLFSYADKKPHENQKQSINKNEILATITGVFYIFSPLLIKDDRYINPIPSHDQVFLNPLIFYLLLKYLTLRKIKYLWFLLLISLIFSHNFSYVAVPALFSFYPMAFLFLIIYVLYILKKKIPFKEILIGVVFFVFLHIFHLGSEFAGVFDTSSSINSEVFSGGYRQELLTYFHGVIGFASLPASILLSPITQGLWSFFPFISFLVVLLAFIKNRPGFINNTISKTFLLTGLIFLAILYLISAKVTFTSIKLYEMFFLYVPGFGMFRSFYIQWLYAFAFFYSLIFGQALSLIYPSLEKKKEKFILLILFLYLIGGAWSFIKGDQFNLFHVQSNNIKRVISVDPQYEKMLEFIRHLPYDGNVLQFPFSDFNYQVLHGVNDGAYIGTSTIGQLTGVKDFAGFWHTAPYTEVFLQSGKERNYATLGQVLGFLNIRYIFHNSDPKIYDSTFFGRPFEYTRQFLSSTQKQYEEFIKPMVGEKLFEAGSYKLYLSKDDDYIPHVYIPIKTILYKNNPKYDKNYYDKFYFAASSFLLNQNVASQSANTEKRVAYIEENSCINKSFAQTICGQNITFNTIPKIYYEKINALKYKVKITNIHNPFLLVFSDTFHQNWKLFIQEDSIMHEQTDKRYFNGDIIEGKSSNIFFDKKTFETLSLKSLPESQHIAANAYANAWYITPNDIGMKQEATFVIEMTGQRIFYFTLFVSFMSLIIFIFWGLSLLITRKF